MSETSGDTSSVDLAYDIAVASYDAAVKRLDSIDSRIQTLLAFAVSASAVVFSATAGRIPFHSLWFYGALTFLLASVSFGIYARWYGDIWLLKPNVFYERWLNKDSDTFKRDLIYWAGCDFIDNMNLVDRKWRLSIAVILFFSLEVACLAVWVVVHHP